MVLVSLTIGHPRIAISQTNNSWKGKVNENLVCLICPNITIKAKYNKCLIRGGGGGGGGWKHNKCSITYISFTKKIVYNIS